MRRSRHRHNMASARGNSDDHREIIRERLASALGSQSNANLWQPHNSWLPSNSASHDELHSRATGIEDAMSDSLRPGSKEYMGKARSLVCNLKSNAGLRAQVISGEFHPSALVAASAQELASEALKVRRQQSAERFASSRSLGSSSDRVVGWQAGTTGRLELPSEVDEVGRTRVDAKPSVAGPDPLSRPLPDPLGSTAAAEAKRKAPPPYAAPPFTAPPAAAPPAAAPPAAAGDVASKRRRKLEPRAAVLRCSAGLCGAPAELEDGGTSHTTRHPRLHVPLCLGHRSLFVRRGKQGWPMDDEGLHDCCQWCCGELIMEDPAGDRGEVVGDRSRQQKREAVESCASLLCDGCDTAWCTDCLDPNPNSSANPDPNPDPNPNPHQVHRLPRRQPRCQLLGLGRSPGRRAVDVPLL